MPEKIELLPEDILDSLSSLQTLLESLDEEGTKSNGKDSTGKKYSNDGINIRQF